MHSDNLLKFFDVYIFYYKFENGFVDVLYILYIYILVMQHHSHLDNTVDTSEVIKLNNENNVESKKLYQTS